MAFDPYGFGEESRKLTGGVGPEVGFPTEAARRKYRFGLSGSQYERQRAEAQARRGYQDIIGALPRQLDETAARQAARGMARSGQYQQALADVGARASRGIGDLLSGLADTQAGTYLRDFEGGVGYSDEALRALLSGLADRTSEEQSLFR